MKSLITLGILTFSLPSYPQDDDLPLMKETMNSYLDQKAERVQIAKDCVMNARGKREVKGCKKLLEQDFDDHAQRIKENRNGN